MKLEIKMSMRLPAEGLLLGTGAFLLALLMLGSQSAPSPLHGLLLGMVIGATVMVLCYLAGGLLTRICLYWYTTSLPQRQTCTKCTQFHSLERQRLTDLDGTVLFLVLWPVAALLLAEHHLHRAYEHSPIQDHRT
ncbi:hypothetical protein [Nocardiopsis sp. JB363]|uniref:hypothetical protein n=1 Tax=Nocardiopsis sp. JB363 TaxID=1434837 RepID=UPI00097B702B|nr:hypothetical protein [Nocardiopsis sp. JB363]SIO87205.1 hypothetical protein BQ8420_15430 [Nocardiopsis sp. JB363]